MSTVTVEFKVSVRFGIDPEQAPNVTKEDLQEMAASAVGSHHSGKGTQLICDGKCQWTKPYEQGKMQAEDAEFADVFVEAETDYDFEIVDVDDEFAKLQ